MTVIATLITKWWSAHASDSFLTTRVVDGSVEQVEDQQSKLVQVDCFRGIISYFGFARLTPGWDTWQWLMAEARGARKHQSPIIFAQHLQSELNTHFRRLSITDRLGIHFTAYEEVDGYTVPELFFLRNFRNDNSHQEFQLRRELYAHLFPSRSDRDVIIDGHKERRLSVREALSKENIALQYFNGEPALYAPIAEAVLTAFRLLYSRGLIGDHESHGTHLAMVRRPVELISKLVADFVPRNKRTVGGRTHDLAVSPTGEYKSNTGD